MENLTSSTDSTSSYLRLYELQKDFFDKRRDIEWKVSIAFWTAIGAASGFSLLQKIQIPPFWGPMFYISVFLCFSIWLYRIRRGHEIDKRWMKVYRSNAEKALGLRDDTERFTKPSIVNCVFNGWFLTAVTITAILLLASWYLLKC